jgi:hypothetical protein
MRYFRELYRSARSHASPATCRSSVIELPAPDTSGEMLQAEKFFRAAHGKRHCGEPFRLWAKEHSRGVQIKAEKRRNSGAISSFFNAELDERELVPNFAHGPLVSLL